MGERPELAERLRDVGNDWPLYMLEDPVSKSRYSSAIDLYPDLQLVALQDDHARTRHPEVVLPNRTPSHHHDRRAAGPLLIRGGNRSLAGTFSQERTHVSAVTRGGSRGP